MNGYLNVFFLGIFFIFKKIFWRWWKYYYIGVNCSFLKEIVFIEFDICGKYLLE